MLKPDSKGVSIHCYTPAMCESKKVEQTNATTSVQFDKITSVNQYNNCKCVEPK